MKTCTETWREEKGGEEGRQQDVQTMLFSFVWLSYSFKYVSDCQWIKEMGDGLQ